MQSSDLTEAQARTLKNKSHPMFGYLAKLKRRMVFKGFRPDDPLLRKVLDAEAAMHFGWMCIIFRAGKLLGGDERVQL